MKPRTMELWLGLFVLVGLLALGMMIVLFGEVLELSQPTYEVTVHFNKVTGLGPGTPVRMLGIDIGKVREVRFRTDGEGIALTLIINEPIDIPSDAGLTVLTEGLLGDNYLEFGSGTGAPLSHAGDAVVTGEAYRSAQEYLKEAVNGFKGTAAVYEDLARNLNKRLSDEEFFGDVKKAAKASAEMMESFKETSSKLQGLADQFSKGVGALSKEIQTLARKIDSQVDHQGENLDKLAEGLLGNIDKLNKTLGSLHEVAESVRKGKGTVGGLLVRDEIYKEMVGTLEKTQSMLDELEETVKFIREHPTKFIWGR